MNRIKTTRTFSSRGERRKGFIVLLLAAGAYGCGGSDFDAGPDADPATAIGCDSTERYWALTTGSTWTMKITDPSDSTKLSSKTQTVMSMETVPGKTGITAYRVVTNKPGGDVTSWQEDTGEGIRRHREENRTGTTFSDELYEPYKLRIDETAPHLAIDGAWTENYDEVVTDVSGGTGTARQSKTESWRVEAIDELVTVPAGTFCTIRVHKTSTANAGGSQKTYWFARGVGKVKEESATQREELTDYSIQ